MKGLFIPDAVVFGSQSGGGNVADLSDIDLTNPVTDSRLIYQCATEHAYFSADDTIQYAAPNVWPLEYRDGVAVGRHEPEPEAINGVKFNTRFADLSVSSSKGRWGLNVTDGVQSETDIAPDGSTSLIVKLTEGGAVTGQGVYARTYNPEQGIKTFSGWCKTSSTVMRCYIEPTPSVESEYQVLQPADGWQRFRVTRDVTGISNYSGNVAFYSFNSVPDADALITGWGWQLESGSIATSPIRTAAESGVREAATASVKNPGSIATSIRMHYSDDTFTDFDFPTDGSDITIPAASADWGTRYITRIEYLKLV